jgi:hypothetical protein
VVRKVNFVFEFFTVGPQGVVERGGDLAQYVVDSRVDPVAV